jgi:MFS family permease
LQTSVADTMRGRLMSTQFFLQQGASSLGVAIVGVVAQYWGLRAPILCGTALALLVWIMTLRERQPVATSTHGGGEAHAIEAD